MVCFSAALDERSSVDKSVSLRPTFEANEEEEEEEGNVEEEGGNLTELVRESKEDVLLAATIDALGKGIVVDA